MYTDFCNLLKIQQRVSDRIFDLQVSIVSNEKMAINVLN